MQRTPELARHLYDRFEPVHAVTYFAPVAPEVVTALFYNFAPWRVAKALPAAWEIAGPQAALRAREDSAVAALRRYGLTDDENVRTAARLAGGAARQAHL